MDLRQHGSARPRKGDPAYRRNVALPRKPAIFGKMWRSARFVAGSPAEAAGVEEIKQGASLIRSLAEALRLMPRPFPRLLVHADQSLDVAATAFSHGLSVVEFEQRLAFRQRQTARMAYLAFVLAWSFLGLWLWQALNSPWSYERVISALEFIPFCAAFFLVSFRSAWLNWQLRVRRLGSVADYLQSSEPFKPS